MNPEDGLGNLEMDYYNLVPPNMEMKSVQNRGRDGGSE